jgi:hypothetical protein
MPLEEVPRRHHDEREDERVGFGDVKSSFDVALRRIAVAELVVCDRIQQQRLDHRSGADDRCRPVEHGRQRFDGRPVVALGESKRGEDGSRLTELVVPVGQAVTVAIRPPGRPSGWSARSIPRPGRSARAQ